MAWIALAGMVSLAAFGTDTPSEPGIDVGQVTGTWMLTQLAFDPQGEAVSDAEGRDSSYATPTCTPSSGSPPSSHTRQRMVAASQSDSARARFST